MQCRYCGAVIDNPFGFCTVCGKLTDSNQKSFLNIGAKALYYIFAICFIVGGAFPCLIQGVAGDLVLSFFARTASHSEMAAFSSLAQTLSAFSPWFFLPASLIAVYVGLLLLKNECKHTVPIILCGVLNAVSAVYTLAVNLLVFCFPQFVLSLYGADESVIAAGVEILRTKPYLLLLYQTDTFLRLNISIVLILLAAALVLVTKDMRRKIRKSARIPSVGNIVMIFSISFAAPIGTLLFNNLVANASSTAAAANALANQSFGHNAVLTAFLLVISLAVIFNRTKRWILALPTVGSVLLLALTALLLTNVLVRDVQASAEVTALAAAYFRGLVIGSAVFLIAAFCWFGAVANKRISMWLQIAWPVLLPLVYLIVELFCLLLLHMYHGISYGALVACLLTMAVTGVSSLFVRPARSAIESFEK